MTTRDDLVSRLKQAQEWIREPDHGEDDFTLDKICDWMNRRQTTLYLEAATALEAANAEIARLTAERHEAINQGTYLSDRISDLQRQLAEETERCAQIAEQPGLWPKIYRATDREKIAAAIRGGAK